MTIAHASLMCHAPIVVPDVVGARGHACKSSTDAMKRAAERIVAKKPDVLIVLSPHTPRLGSSFSLVEGVVRGSFADFGAPDVAVEFPEAKAARARLLALANEKDVALEELRLRRLDHGALVPLAFMRDAGFVGPTVVIGLSSDPAASELVRLGEVLRDASGRERWAIIASGDCSHRLIPGAPAGFHPEAQRFDTTLKELIAAGDDKALLSFDATLRDLAAEDVLDTVQIANAACAYEKRGREVLSYEGPYGVGYLVAILHEEEEAAAVLLDVAKDALRSHLTGEARSSFDTKTLDATPVQGLFVTWRHHGGELRGCVGRMNIDVSVSAAAADLAVSAALNDPRFPPIRLSELGALECEVTLLEPPEPVYDVATLDPAVFGVEARASCKHAVLLPGIEGIDTVEQQLGILLRKAGIREGEAYTLRRFRARKVQ